MLTLIRNGGVPMLFILLFGLVALVTAAWAAARKSERHLGFIQSMAKATLFATLAGTAADIGATCTYVASHPPMQIDILVEGMGESTSPGIVGFTLLSLTYLMLAVAKRRLDAAS